MYAYKGLKTIYMYVCIYINIYNFSYIFDIMVGYL